MSNVKQVEIQGEVPFDWTHRLTPEDFKLIGSLVLNPSIGLRLFFSTDPIANAPNSHGGQTAIYGFSIQGSEALSSIYLERLCAAFRRHGVLREARYFDIESGERTWRYL